eukprot:1948727-Karenia_brevis.AAC.1
MQKEKGKLIWQGVDLAHILVEEGDIDPVVEWKPSIVTKSQVDKDGILEQFYKVSPSAADAEAWCL